jgi:integrase
MASIRKIETEAGGTRWRMRVYIGSDPETGKRTYVTRTFERKKDADKEARRLERAKDIGSLKEPSKEPLSKYLQKWLDNVKEGRVRARTLHDYRGMIRRYIQEPPEGAPPIGKIRLHHLQGGAFEELYAHLWREEGLSPRTLQYLHTILRQALGHAVATGALPRNPTDNVKPPKQAREGETPKKAMRAMSREEAGRFMEKARSDDLAALWSVLLLGGLRPGEAFGLRWDDVDLESGRLHVRHALTRRGVPKFCACGHPRKVHGEEGHGGCKEAGCKGCKRYRSAKGWRLVEPKTDRARRVVVLPEVATALLREHRKRQAETRLKLGSEWADHRFVFTATFGTPLDLANLYGRFKALLKEAELGTDFRLYDLRHTCATLLLLAGEHAKVVSERLGHASITLTLDTYSHVLPSMQEGSADKLEAMFGSV